MKDSNDINHIRVLLERYYDGTATPSEQNVISDYFRTSTDIPEDLSADAEIFRAIGDLKSLSSEDMVPPADLEARLLGIVDRSRHHFSYKTLIWSLSAAAAIALLISVGWRMVNGGDRDLMLSDERLLAEMAHDVDTLTTDGSYSPADLLSGDVSTAPLHREEARQIRPELNSHDSNVADTGDGYIDITDSIEAKRIASEVLELLAYNMDRATESINETEDKIISINNTLNNYLQ